MAKDNLECSFCGRKKSETNLLIAGLDAHICDRCIDQAYGIVQEEISTHKKADVDKGLCIQNSTYQWCYSLFRSTESC